MEILSISAINTLIVTVYPGIIKGEKNTSASTESV